MKNALQKIKKALILTILISGCIHLGSLIIYSFMHHTIAPLNAFGIISLGMFAPILINGTTMFIVSWLFIGVVFLISLLISDNKK